MSSLSSPIHAVKPSLSFKVVNYIVHCLLPKTIKPTLWTSRDFSQSVSNIGLYNLWQGGIFTNFSLAYIPVSQSQTLVSFFFWILSPTYFPHGKHAAGRSEEVSLKKEKERKVRYFSFLCHFVSQPKNKQTNVALNIFCLSCDTFVILTGLIISEF